MTRLLTVLIVVFAMAVPAVGQTITLDNGLAPNVEGFLDVTTDQFGSWASTAFGGPGDRFRPTGWTGGPASIQDPTFATTTYVFANGVDSSILSLNADINPGVCPAPGCMPTMTLTPGSLGPGSDGNGDGVIDTVVSDFTLGGGMTGQELSFSLTQNVDVGPMNHVGGASAVVNLVYTVTNTGPTQADLNIVRVIDPDLLYGTAFTDDSVGTSRHLGDPGVWQENPDNPVNTAINMTTSDSPNSQYYGAKAGYEPPNGPPTQVAGTNSLVFDNLGIPASWENLIAGVGYNVDGDSSTTLPGPGMDGSIAAQLQLSVAPGATETFSFNLTYGDRPAIVPEPSSCLLLLASLGLAGLLRRR